MKSNPTKIQVLCLTITFNHKRLNQKNDAEKLEPKESLILSKEKPVSVKGPQKINEDKDNIKNEISQGQIKKVKSSNINPEEILTSPGKIEHSTSMNLSSPSMVLDDFDALNILGNNNNIDDDEWTKIGEDDKNFGTPKLTNIDLTEIKDNEGKNESSPKETTNINTKESDAGSITSIGSADLYIRIVYSSENMFYRYDGLIYSLSNKDRFEVMDGAQKVSSIKAQTIDAINGYHK